MATAIDYASLPPPEVIQPLSYEAILTDLRAELVARYPAAQDALAVEGSVLVKTLEMVAARILLIRAEGNDQAKASMLAYAYGATLDNLASDRGIFRLVIDPGDSLALPPRPPVYETDTELRRRAQLAPEAFTTAGTREAILSRALEADPAVRDAAVISPAPGEVEVYVLARDGDGTPTAETITRVWTYLEPRRPLSIVFSVLPAQVTTFAVDATITLLPGPSAADAMAAVEARLRAFVTEQNGLGRDVTLSGLYGAMHIIGVVQNVQIVAPAADIVVGEAAAAFCGAITLTLGGRDV